MKLNVVFDYQNKHFLTRKFLYGYQTSCLNYYCVGKNPIAVSSGLLSFAFVHMKKKLIFKRYAL